MNNRISKFIPVSCAFSWVIAFGLFLSYSFDLNMFFIAHYKCICFLIRDRKKGRRVGGLKLGWIEGRANVIDIYYASKKNIFNKGKNEDDFAKDTTYSGCKIKRKQPGTT